VELNKEEYEDKQNKIKWTKEKILKRGVEEGEELAHPLKDNYLGPHLGPHLG